MVKLRQKKWGHLKITNKNKKKLKVIAGKEGRTMASYLSWHINTRYKKINVA